MHCWLLALAYLHMRIYYMSDLDLINVFKEFDQVKKKQLEAHETFSVHALWKDYKIPNSFLHLSIKMLKYFFLYLLKFQSTFFVVSFLLSLEKNFSLLLSYWI